MKRKRTITWLGVIVSLLIIIGLSVYIFRDNLMRFALRPTTTSIEQNGTAGDRTLDIVSDNLNTPWSITFLDEGDMLITERSGQMLRIGTNGQTYQIEGVQETSEGGLLGIALHPQFSENKFVYLYMTINEDGVLMNQVVRYVLDDGALRDRRLLLGAIPAASNHNGGAIAFGPDEKLYVTTGDAASEDLAQDTSSLAGKILRVNDDGSPANDNPFGNEVWSYGHRNPQGIAWDDKGQLWSVEHGPSGASSGRDELNLIVRGGNYGWPIITGDETESNLISPVVQSGDNETWAPAGLAYMDGVLYFAGLRGQSLYEATLNDTRDGVTLTRSLTEEHGRLRAVTAHDNAIYLSTSNTDGRGTPRGNDDRILRLTDL